MKSTNNWRKLGRRQKGCYQRGLNTAILRGHFQYEGKYCVYGLTTEDEPNIVHYVGCTKSSLNRRYNNHLSQAKKERSPKERWIWQLIQEGKNMVMVVLEDGISTYDDACDREQFYIQKMRDENHPIKNATRGGKGALGRIVSEESRLKTSHSNKGKRLGITVSEETRRKMIASRRNRKQRAAEEKAKRGKK